MPYGYLTNGIVFAILITCALVPPRRPRILAGLAFGLGLGTSELPQLAAFVVLAATVVVAAQGELAAPGAWAAFGLNMLDLVGLAVVAATALRARAVLDAAVPGRRPRRRPWARILLWPWRTPPASVRRVANVRYAEDGGRRTSLDVYHHRARPVGGPVLIHLHGGAFVSGRKSTQAMPLLHHLAARGWVCISANYRLRPARWPTALVDAKRVVAWAHRHAQDYGGDPTTVFIAGTSAGGHLAADVALTQNDPRWSAPEDGITAVDTTVAGAIVLGGYLGPVGDPPTSPGDFARADAPPMLIIHGANDTIVPPAQARGFVAALRAAGATEVHYAELPGAHHGFDLFHSLRFAAIIEAVESFTAAAAAPPPALPPHHDDHAVRAPIEDH